MNVKLSLSIEGRENVMASYGVSLVEMQTDDVMKQLENLGKEIDHMKNFDKYVDELDEKEVVSIVLCKLFSCACVRNVAIFYILCGLLYC